MAVAASGGLTITSIFSLFFSFFFSSGRLFVYFQSYPCRRSFSLLCNLFLLHLFLFSSSSLFSSSLFFFLVFFSSSLHLLFLLFHNSFYSSPFPPDLLYPSSTSSFSLFFLFNFAPFLIPPATHSPSPPPLSHTYKVTLTVTGQPLLPSHRFQGD